MRISIPSLLRNIIAFVMLQTTLAAHVHRDSANPSPWALISPPANTMLPTPQTWLLSRKGTSKIKRDDPSFTNEIIELDGGWTAFIQTTALFLPTGPACAALIKLYSSTVTFVSLFGQVAGQPSTLRPAAYLVGDLRLAWNCGTISGTMQFSVLQQLLGIMEERARLGMPLAWRGILVHGGNGQPWSSAQVWNVIVDVGNAWLGWR